MLKKKKDLNYAIRKQILLLACVTSIIIGWTSAKYLTIISASDLNRSGKFGFSIDSRVYHIVGENEYLYSERLEEYSESKENINSFNIDTGNDNEYVKIVFTIKIQNETQVRLQIDKDTYKDKRPMKIESVQVSSAHLEHELSGNTEGNTLFSIDINPSIEEIEYECTIIVSYNGNFESNYNIDGDDNYISLTPIIRQINMKE